MHRLQASTGTNPPGLSLSLHVKELPGHFLIDGRLRELVESRPLIPAQDFDIRNLLLLQLLVGPLENLQRFLHVWRPACVTEQRVAENLEQLISQASLLILVPLAGEDGWVFAISVPRHVLLWPAHLGRAVHDRRMRFVRVIESGTAGV